MESSIEDIIRNTETVLGLTITIHDLLGIFRGPDGNRLLSPNRTTHQHVCCRTASSQRCLKECFHHANRESGRKGISWLHFCYKGLVEIVTPLIRNDTHFATLFAGTFRTDKAPPGQIRSRVFKKEYSELPVIDTEKAEKLGSLLFTMGQGLLAQVESMNNIANSTERGRKAEIRRFFYYRSHESITLSDLASAIHISPTRTSHVVTELFGESFRALLMRERIQRSRTLLLTTNYSVAEVARRVGMPDEYHFNRAFKKLTGLPPGKFRRRENSPRILLR